MDPLRRSLGRRERIPPCAADSGKTLAGCVVIPCTHSPFVQQRTTAFPRSSCSLLRYPSGSLSEA